MKDAAAAAVFSDPDTYATCLLALGLDRFSGKGVGPGDSPLHWAEETWAAEVEHLCGAPPAQRNLDRIMGAVVLLTRPHEFYESEAGFGDVVQAIAADWFDRNVWHPPTTAECLWAVVEAYLLDPPEDKSAPRFSPAVCGYVAAVAREEGFPSLPDVFKVFGLVDDPDLPPPHDYSGDPALFAASQSGLEARREDLNGWLGDRLADLADRLRRLPLKSGRGAAVADEILQTLGG